MAIQLHGVEKTTAHNAPVLTAESLRARMGKGFASSLERRQDRDHLTTIRAFSLRPQRLHRIHDRCFPRRHICRNARDDKK